MTVLVLVANKRLRVYGDSEYGDVHCASLPVALDLACLGLVCNLLPLYFIVGQHTECMFPKAITNARIAVTQNVV